MRVPTLDEELGMTVYSTDSAGIGGVIRREPEDFLVEETLVDGSVATIQRTHSAALGASASQQRYLLGIMVKRRWDTFIAVRNIAQQLGIDQARISVAGIKDAKAVTAQHVTFENVTADDIGGIHVKDIEIRTVGYFRDAMSQFYLLGNRFIVTIKAAMLSESTVKRRITRTIEELEAQGGIPNFFGHQRFGTTRAITHRVGKAIVNGEIQKAVMLFLAEPSLHEHPESRKAREELQADQNFAQALQNFPNQLRFERIMLQHLAEKPTDFTGALRRLPIRLQALFVQAYQSYLFNRFLSERIRSGFPLNIAQIGDYTIRVERSGLPMPKTGKLATASSLADTNESIYRGKMRVALPLVGFGQRLSEGEMKRIETRILEEEGIEQASFRVPAMPRIGCRGELRAVASPIRDFRVQQVMTMEHKNDTQVKLGFMLLRGSYATMLLREVMKPKDPIIAGF